MLRSWNLYLLIAVAVSSPARSAGVDSVVVALTLEAAEAQRVFVAGSFNGWNATADSMQRAGDSWSTTLLLPPGYYYYKFVVDGNWITDPANPRKVNDGGDGFNSILKVGDPPTPVRNRNSEPLPRDSLPFPILPDHQDWIELYWAAWEMLWGKLASGTPENGFAARYLDEGFNEQVYQWDSCFMALFALYGRDVFPAMAALDNFYAKQRDDGYLQRVYQEADGSEVAEPTEEEPLVNPPLFAWAEWNYVKRTGDTTRVRRVLPHLVNYHRWLAVNCRSEGESLLYCNTPLGSGMDNVPRHTTGRGAWIDMSAQMALAAKCISSLGALIDDPVIAKSFDSDAGNIARRIEETCWDEARGAYVDVNPAGVKSPSLHIGTFWPLLACEPSERTDRLIQLLHDQQHFSRPVLIPALSASDPEYSRLGHYWQGGVWAPTNYMVVRGLETIGQHDEALRIAMNYLRNMSAVYSSFVPAEDSIAFEERYADGYHTIWECYAPERAAPATRWDNTFYSRQDFVGWSGLGPIAMLIETLLGLEADGLSNTITWTPLPEETQGIQRFPLREQKVDLMYDRDQIPPRIRVTCEAPFLLNVVLSYDTLRYDITSAGAHRFLLESPK